MAKKAPRIIVAVGDHVRLKSRTANQYAVPSTSPEGGPQLRDPAEGLVFSIRSIETGAYVAEASGDLEKFVIELLYEHTFNPRFASLRNVPRGAERSTTTPGWNRMREVLKKSAQEGHFRSTSSPDLLTDSPLAKMIDGWKIIKVWAKDIDRFEEPAPAETPEE